MKHIAALVIISSINTLAISKDIEIIDESSIEVFLKRPGITNFNYPEVKNWKHSRKYIQVGQKLTDGSCRFSDELVSKGSDPTVKIELAVDRKSCESLILEGAPDSNTWFKFLEFQEFIKNRQKNKNITPGINDKGIIIAPEKQGKTKSIENSLEVQSNETSASKANQYFNSGGTVYRPKFEIQYTDGKNPLMQGVLGSVLQTIVGLLGVQLGNDGILAASTSISHHHELPTSSPIDGNCYYTGDKGAVFAQHIGYASFNSGSIGWNQNTQDVCSAIIIGNTNTTYAVAYSSNTPGQNLSQNNSSACEAKSKLSFANSCSNKTSNSYHSIGYHTSASASFSNNSYLPGAFDCRNGGLNIYFEDMQIKTLGTGSPTISGSSRYTGPHTGCAENLSRIVINDPIGGQ